MQKCFTMLCRWHKQKGQAAACPSWNPIAPSRLLLGLGVVFFLVDFPAQPVLFLFDLQPLFRSKAAAILAVLPDLFVQPGLFAFEPGGLFGSQFAVLNTAGNSLLLVPLTLGGPGAP